LVILRKLGDISTFLWGATMRMVFFEEMSHYANAKVKILLRDPENYCAFSSLLQDYLGGSV